MGPRPASHDDATIAVMSEPPVHTPTHAAPAAVVDEQWRALVRRGADLARRDPARWSASVRRQDSLVAAGMDRREAHRLSLEEAEA